MKSARAMRAAGCFRASLAADGRKVGRLHVRALMKRMGIEAIYRRPNTSKREPGHKIFPYLLRKLPVTRPNQVWAMDLTYIPMARGFVYLAAVIDWFSRHCQNNCKAPTLDEERRTIMRHRAGATRRERRHGSA